MFRFAAALASALVGVIVLSGCPGACGGAPAGPAAPAAAPQAPTATAGPTGEFADPGGTMQGREGPLERITAIVCVGETLGWLEPCGCAEGMLGGLPRRASFLKQLQARGIDPICIDLGDVVREPGRQTELK